MDTELLGVDIGGTTINVGLVQNNVIKKESSISVSKDVDADATLQLLISAIKDNISEKVAGIGIGVPAVVDPLTGVVYDVQNIPAWKEIPLKEIVEKEFDRPVYINNDANCFALGESVFGKGKAFKNVIGLSIGTGLGMGIVINGQLYNGVLCGAGEIGMLGYKDSIVENYTSSFFFVNKYNDSALNMYNRARRGEEIAVKAFDEFGIHLGEAVKSILYMFAPEAIVLGGSISKAYPFFKASMNERLKSFAYQKQIENLVIATSNNPGSAILGAAALCLQEIK